VEKKYYADGEDAYSMKKDLTDLLNARDKERDQRAALHKAKRMKEGKPTNEIAVLERKVKELKVTIL
jgi:phage-related protein